MAQMKKNKWNEIFSSKKHEYLKKSYIALRSSNKNKFEKLAFKLSKIINKSNFIFFKRLTKIIATRFKLNNSKDVSIADYGSGNGFILFYLKKKYGVKKIFSFETVKNYLKFQKKLINNAKFIHVKQSNKKIPLGNNTTDYFFTCSVFQYLNNLNQAKCLLKEFIRTSKKGILILDIFDYAKKKEHLKYKFLSSKLSKKEYSKKFKNLKLNFYKKNFFYFLKNEKKVDKLFFFKMPRMSFINRYSYCLFIKLK